MNIGLDYGGVISFNVGRWQDAIECAIQKQSHKVFIISHAQEGADAETRERFSSDCGAKNLTFTDLMSGSQENEIALRKAKICQEYEIDLFIDDDNFRAATVGANCPKCAVFYVPQNKWQLGLELIDHLGEPL